MLARDKSGKKENMNNNASFSFVCVEKKVKGK